MFDPVQSKIDLLAAISALDPWKIGTLARHDELQGRADYIRELGRAVQAHVEYLAAEADASICMGRISDDASLIADCTSDIAGEIREAADKMREIA